MYNDGNRRLQDRFDTRRLADRIEDRIVHDTIDDDDRRFIEARDMYLSAGNLLVNPKVGLLFIDFEGRKRMRLNGVASVDEDDPLLGEYPEAQLIVRVRATEVFPNCPRYIHQYELVLRSRFVPREKCETPVPAWKRREWANDVLRTRDPAYDDSREVLER